VHADELDPPVRVGWKTLSGGGAPACWDGTRITFEMSPQRENTVLSFAHRGFANADKGFALVTSGWGYYLISLQQYLETGTGAPHPDADFSRVIP
jgi:hypothetical protein